MRNPKLWRIIAVATLAVLVVATFSVGLASSNLGGATSVASTTSEPTEVNCADYEGTEVLLCEDSKDPAFQELYSAYGVKAQEAYCMFLTTKTVNSEAVAATQALAEEARADAVLQSYSSGAAITDDIQESADTMKTNEGTPVSEEELTYMESVCASSIG